MFAPGASPKGRSGRQTKSGAFGSVVGSLVLDGTDLLSADRAVELTTNDNVAFSVNATRQVGAGSHTVSLEAESNDSTTFDNSELNVLFVPFGAAG